MTREEYIRNVGSALGDLPWKQRQELLAELRGHLADFPADTDLTERLGTPDQYAADLRTAEGLERRRGLVAWFRARRPRNVIATLVAFVVIGLVAGGIDWVQSYQPLAADFGGILPTQLKQARNGADKPLVYQRNGHFRFGIPIRNNGPFGVRIDGLGGWEAEPVALMPNPPLTFSYTLAMTHPVSEWENQRGPLFPFKPFELAPGKTAMLFVEATFKRSCRPWAPGQIAVPVASGFNYPWNSLIPVRYHFAWKNATALVAPPFSLQIRFPKGCD